MLPSAPAGRGLTAGQQRRRAIGKSLALSGFVEVLPTPFLPAGVFDVWGLPADDPRRGTTQVLNPLEADRPQLATTLLPGLLEALVRNVSRGIGRRRAVRHRAGGAADRADQGRRADPGRTDGPPTTRSPCSTRRCRGSPARRGGADRAAGAARPVGRRPSRRRRRRVRGGADHRRASGVDVTLRAAQYLPWHPGRCAEVLVGRDRRRSRRATASGGDRTHRPAQGHLRRRAGPRRASRSSRRCPRPRCRRFRRCSRTSAWSSPPTSRRRPSSTPCGRRGRAARGRPAVRRLHRPADRRRPEVADVGAAVPRAGPHAHRGRGQRGPGRRRAPRPRSGSAPSRA